MKILRGVAGYVKWIRSGLFFMNRELISRTYLSGSGIEIGALHNPLRVPKSARVKYIDRMSVPELAAQYPELDPKSFVKVDIKDDAEKLSAISESTQDFVIANHFLEHCQDPIGAVSNMLRVLKPGGVLYLAVPDKRYTFDKNRPVTGLDHLFRDYEEGPAWSYHEHVEEWVRLVNKVNGERKVAEGVKECAQKCYSIHYHVWTQAEMLEFILAMKRMDLNFEVEVFLKIKNEVVIVLRKDTKR